MDIECRRKYQFNEFRKNNILRLKKFMNELLLDQIPVLNEMLRPLEELRLIGQGKTPDNSNTFMLEQIPELQPKICKGKNWHKIAKFQKKKYFGKQSQKQLKKEMNQLNDLYGYNMIDGLIDGFQCGNCKKGDATKRCSKCKSEWYCGRDCQVKHWKEHKVFCKQIYETMILKKAKEQANKKPKIEEVKLPKQEQKPRKVMVQEVDAQSNPKQQSLTQDIEKNKNTVESDTQKANKRSPQQEQLQRKISEVENNYEKLKKQKEQDERLKQEKIKEEQLKEMKIKKEKFRQEQEEIQLKQKLKKLKQGKEAQKINKQLKQETERKKKLEDLQNQKKEMEEQYKKQKERILKEKQEQEKEVEIEEESEEKVFQQYVQEDTLEESENSENGSVTDELDELD